MRTIIVNLLLRIFSPQQLSGIDNRPASRLLKPLTPWDFLCKYFCTSLLANTVAWAALVAAIFLAGVYFCDY